MMEIPQSSLSVDEVIIEQLIELQLMTDIEAMMSGKRIDEVTGNLTSAPLGDEYIMAKLQTSKQRLYDEDEDAEPNVKEIQPMSFRDRSIFKKFIRGSRTNPYPERGSIIKIKLAESVKEVKMDGGKIKDLVVEKHVQMNYDTGEWSIDKIYRDLHGTIVPTPPARTKNNKRKRN